MIEKCTLTTNELFTAINHPDWVILDCRFDLTRPDWGYQDYQLGHIPGAIYAHIDQDFSKPATKESGRHPLPNAIDFSKTISKWGITKNKYVVIYDTVGGAFAARLWWMLRNIGYAQIFALDGGFPLWVKEGKPIEMGITHGIDMPLTNFDFDSNQIVTTQQVLQIINEKLQNIIMIDARAPKRYSGEFEPIDPIAGHIPGAINRFHEENLTPQGIFKTPEKLREEYTRLLHGTPAENAIFYCGSGVTSCHNILAMEIAGLNGAKLYAGSWSEWIRDPNRPIKTGGNP